MSVSIEFDRSAILPYMNCPTYLRRLQLQQSIFRRDRQWLPMTTRAARSLTVTLGSFCLFEIRWAYEILPDQSEGMHGFRSQKGTATSMESSILLKLKFLVHVERLSID